MTTFKKPTLYSPEMIGDVLDFSGWSRKKLTNRHLAKLFKVDEKTIRNWRKEHGDFDYAINNADMLWAKLINKTTRMNLEPREKITVIKDSDGNTKAVREQVLPTHQDLLAAQKLGISKPLGGFEEQRRQDVLERVGKAIRTGEMSFIDAVCDCDVEGVDMPESWKRREYGRLLRLYEEKKLNIRQLARELRIAGLKVEPELQAEIAKELNLPPPVPDLPPMRELFEE